MGGRMKIAVLGYGAIAKRHLANLRAQRPSARAMVLRARDLPLEESDACALRARSFGDILEFAPDAAIIASPASEHIPQALALARRGAHLLVEKPLSHNLDGVGELIGLCAERGLALMVGYNMAHMPLLSDFISLARGGAVGELLSVQAEVGQYLPDWRPSADYRQCVSARAELGGGVLLELSHELEYADRLIGGTKEVFCFSRRTGLLDLDAEDAADVLLRSAAGVVASIHLNMEQRPPYRSCRVAGTEGMLYLNFTDGTLYKLRPGEKEWRPSKECAPPDRNQMYASELAHFLACAEGGGRPFPDGERGRMVMEIITAAKTSAAKGASVSI